MRVRRMLAAVAGAIVAAALSPSAALAHGLVGRTDLPIPRWLFAWGAAVVLVVSFVALATLWPTPRLERAREKPRLRVPAAALEPLCGLVGIAAFAVCIYAGFAGTQTPTANLLPTVIYVLFWVGLPFLSVLLGDVWAPFNPWRALARGVGWMAKRVGGGAMPEPLPYPERVGRWPAAAGIVAFAWVELVYANRDVPSTLAIMALAYAAVQLLGMSLYGVEPWTRRADAFSVYFNLLSRLSPLRWVRGRLSTRAPLAGVVALTPVAGTVALLCAMIGTTSFDGFSQGPTWNSIAPHLQRGFIDIGLNQEHALEAAFTVGLAGVLLAVGGLYRLGVTGMRGVGRRRRDVNELARAFVHSLVPIAFAYVVAHYFSLLAYQGQAAAFLVSDPLGNGSDLFGTAGSTIDYNVISATGIWYVQVGALVLGHAAGLTLAHDRALTMWSDAREAMRSQYWMLGVMVCFTSLGLWLLSAASA